MKSVVKKWGPHIGCPVLYSVENMSGTYPAVICDVRGHFVFVDFDDPKYGKDVMVTPRTLSLVCDMMHTSTA